MTQDALYRQCLAHYLEHLGSAGDAIFGPEATMLETLCGFPLADGTQAFWLRYRMSQDRPENAG